MLEEHPDLASLRADALRNLRAVAWALATEARGDGTSCPTWSLIIARTGLAWRTVGRHLRWLQDRELLTTLETGSRDPETGETRAAVYALTQPAPPMTRAPLDEVSASVVDLPVHENGTPRCSPVGRTPNAGTRETSSTSTAASRPGWSLTRPATTRQERLELVRRLQAEQLTLRPASERALRSILRPWLEAGWTIADVEHALNRRPDDTSWTYEAAVRDPVAWLRWRMRPWTGHPAPSARRAAELRASRAAQAAARVASRLQSEARTECGPDRLAEMKQTLRTSRPAPAPRNQTPSPTTPSRPAVRAAVRPLRTAIDAAPARPLAEPSPARLLYLDARRTPRPSADPLEVSKPGHRPGAEAVRQRIREARAALADT